MIKLLNEDILKADFSGLPPVNLVVTSPPYNVNIKYDQHNDTMTYSEYLEWCKSWIKQLYHHMAEDGRLCINIPFSITPEHINTKKGAEDINFPVVADYSKICESIGFKYWRTIIWDKNLSNKTCWGSWRSASSPFMRDPSEAILVFYKNQWKRLQKGTSTISGPEFMSWTKNVWKMQPETKSKHPAAFPIELPNRCIKLFSYKEDTILDCFMGSGTTGEAAARLDRNFIGIEKSTNYFNQAKERIDAAVLQTSISKQIMPNIPIDHKKDIFEAW
ncbi:MAG TPA: site-specific DNA-methyltransferase [Bacteroidales bacterium]|nr:site-specific DNA-methyltransferase [Bacteroidales bacterium]